MRRFFLKILTFAILVFPVTAAAEMPQISRPTMRALEAIMQQANSGDIAGALQQLLDLRETIANSGEDTPVRTMEGIVLAFQAGNLKSAMRDPEGALAFYLEAAERAQVHGPIFLPAAAIALENAAGVEYGLERPREAYERLATARELRAAIPPDFDLIKALRLAAHIAIQLRDVELVVAELEIAARFTPGGDGYEEKLVLAQSAAIGVQLATWLGYYSLADLFADTVGGLTSEISSLLWIWEPGIDEKRPRICNELSELLQDVASSRIDFGNYAGANTLLVHVASSLREPMSCADTLKPEAQLYTDSIMARLLLRTGDPLSAHMRLQAFEEQLPESGLSPGERGLSEGIATARKAEARLALGFPGEARQLLSKVESGIGQAEASVYERDRLMAAAKAAHLAGETVAAMRSLDTADSLAAEHVPLHWFPRADIAFRKAMILIEEGRPEEARAVRDRFENELAALVAAQRDAVREADAQVADSRLAFNTGIFGEKGALEIEQKHEQGRFETPAFRELDSMRVLFDLSMAAHHGEADAAAKAFVRANETGLPGSVAMTDHAQRAYLMSCIKAYGLNLQCSMAIRDAFQNPARAPLGCVNGCVWLNNEAWQVTARDMVRNLPLISRFAEPVLSRLISNADEASERNTVMSGSGASVLHQDPSLARRYGGSNGSELAFELVQHMVEGGAAAAVEQIGARLAEGTGEVADLMRERQQTAAQVDALFRGEVGEPGISSRLANRMRELNLKLTEIRPDHAGLFNPSPLSPGDIAELLPQGSAFVMVTSTEAATYVFAVRGGELEWHRAPIGQADLEQRVLRLRISLDPDAANRGATSLTGKRAPRTRAFDRVTAHAIYRDILAPVFEFIGGAELYVVADGPLASLPLSVLVRSEPQGDDDDPVALRQTDWLARAHAITLLPSPAALRVASLQRTRPRGTAPFIGFGDPVFSPESSDNAPFGTLASLPGTRREIRRLATLLGGGDDDVFLGTQATKAAILSADLSQARVLAFATHGLLSGQVAGTTEPGLVFTHPGADKGMEASYLSASEAATLDINADWVLLSACNTAGPDGRPDSAGLSGLARAFLFAGARSVLVSYWPVRDDAAMILTTSALDWHARHPAASRAAAMQQAMAAMLSRDDVPDFAHPSAWAPFVLLGDG